METSVEPRASMVRCYECGSSRVFALCHHCWRPGCAKHVQRAPRWEEKAFGREGGGPGLQNDHACHCGDCGHMQGGIAGPTSRFLAVAAAGIGLAVIGLIVADLSPVVGPILVVAGAIAFLWSYRRARQAAVQRRLNMPVPLHPKVSDIELIERVHGEITLGSRDADYRTVLEPVEGTVSAKLTFGRPDSDRVNRRRKRLRTEPAEVRYCAGRFMLQGQFGIRPCEQIVGPVIALDGEAGDHAVFRAVDPPSSSLWEWTRSYELRAEPEISSGPVWITPSIIPESDRHGLELDIQWVEFGPDKEKPVSLDTIELLRLEFPVDWGDIHSWGVLQQGVSVPQRAVKGLTPEGRQWLELKRMRPATGEQGGEQGGKKRAATRLTLSIQFEGEVKQDDEISGRLEAIMRGTLSGITGIRMFNSLGGPRGIAGRTSVKTRVEVNFRLSLASIRYEAFLVVPDRAAEDSDRESQAENFTLVPDDETVIALTNAMSEEGYYVKHVIENPPRSGRRADLVQRYWDIAGRRYEGVYPVDFHIILTGEEVHSGGIRPESGTTKVRIVVRGAYTDEDMETRIGDEWKRLHELTLETLGRSESTRNELA
jgi:hypothetical protein